MLQIRLLGQFDVRIDGKRVAISSRVGQSLFAYLVLTAGIPHRREKLAGMFWPDTSDENSRKNLRNELWRIRKAINAQQATESEYLLADEFTLTFNHDAEYWLDVSQMERPDLDLQSLTSNLSLYQGELVPGFYDDWIVLERERIQAIFESRMEQLLEQLVVAERWIAIQEWGERWLAFGKAPEPAYRALMLASGVHGDMAKVTSLYQRCTDDLQEHLGVKPSAETRALYDGLRKGTKAPLRTAAQPSGTVTFLFTDIEESTNLLDKLGDQYAAVLTEHHEILRDAVQEWNGREVDTQGDAFFVTFSRALDAVQCAADAQRALASHTWPQGERVRVRMGLHTGEPLISSTGYVGMDVHRASRIGDAGHGGQVLLSQTTRELVIHDLPEGMTIRDLGEHRLKDMKYPASIYQLVIEGLPVEFPALRTKFTGTEAPIAGEAPFKGLQFFDESDSDLFFGREVQTTKLVHRLLDTQFLSVIIGASGSGKSSLVRAGLIPALKKGNALMDGTKPPDGSADWQVHVITPTAHPLEALATELTRDTESVTATTTLMDDLAQDPRSLSLFLNRLNPRQHTLLVVDQFEELFTLCHDEFEREAFIDNLLTTITHPSFPPVKEEMNVKGNITIVLTLRADFYAHLAQYPELRDAVAQQQEYIGPMTSEELRRAIEEPARRGHWEFEPGLVDLILRDVGNEPGALPLLSHALLETWKRRAGHRLTLRGYADSGGVRGAIAYTAETVYQQLSPKQQSIARNIFLRLTELGEGTEDTRRRATISELISKPEESDQVRVALNTLADARLITTGEDTAEVAHEALIREWPRLRDWLTQDREGLILHRHLTEATHEWELLERDPGALYRGARLVQAREWASLHKEEVNDLEREFLNASQSRVEGESAEREAQRQRELESARKLVETEKERAEEQTQSADRLRIRNRVISIVGVVALLLAVLASVFGLQSNQNAMSAQVNAAQAINAKATAQTESLIRATAQADAEQAAALSFARELAVQSELNLEVDPERSILLALAGLDVVYTHEAENALHKAVQSSRVRMTLTGHTAEVNDVVFSPDGKRLASSSEDGVRVWDPTTGQQLLFLGDRPNASDVAFSPDGSRLAFATFDPSGPNWFVVTIRDINTGRELLTLKINGADFWMMNFSPDGSLWVGENGKIEFFDATSGQPLPALTSPDWIIQGHPLIVADVAFSADGKRLAIALTSQGSEYNSGMGRVEIWDMASRQRLLTLPENFDIYPDHPGVIAFSPDGTALATQRSPDGLPAIWDAATGQKLFELGSTVNSLTYSPDGKYILTASTGGKAQMWEATTGKLLLSLRGHQGGIGKVSVSPGCISPPEAPVQWCGLRLASAGSDKTIKIWDISPGGGQESLMLPGALFFVDPNWTRVTTFSGPDLTVGAGTGPPILHPGVQNTLHSWALPDWTGVATAPLQVSNYTSSVPIIDPASIFSMIFPSGKLVAGYKDLSLKIWDVSSGEAKLVTTLCCSSAPEDSGNYIAWVDFSPDGRLMAVGIDHANVDIWDLSTSQKVKTLDVLVSQQLTFSPDGDRLAMGMENRQIQIWDVATGQKVLSMDEPGLTSLMFSPDGKWLLAGICGSVEVLDAATLEKKFSFSGLTSCTPYIAFSPDGRLLAISSKGPIKVWDWATHEELLQLPVGFPGGFGRKLQFNPDGTRLMTVVNDPSGLVLDTVRVYVLPTEDIIALAKSRLTRTLTPEECQQYLHMDVCPAVP
jgi:WD40 repeat protein/class 3 adenylate cyclase